MFATIYTDASGIEGVFGYSYYTRCDKGRHSGTGVVADNECRDINYAEMYCIVKAIEESIAKFNDINRILVVTDSMVAQYTLWRDHEKAFFENGYWDTICKNPPGCKTGRYDELVKKFSSLEGKVEKIMIKWTKGHRGGNTDRAYLNNKCDQRAYRAVRVSKNEKI